MREGLTACLTDSVFCVVCHVSLSNEQDTIHSDTTVHLQSQCQNNPALQKHLHNVPVLVVDCNPDIDVENDVQARESFAKQVNDYWDYVHQYKQAQQGFRVTGTPNTPLQLLLKQQRGRDGGITLPSLLSVQ